MQATEFRPYRKNTLRGFFILELANGFQIKDCTLHESHGKSWIGFPGIPWTDKEGKTQYKNVVLVPDRARLDKLQAEVCAQLRQYLDGPGESSAQKAHESEDRPPF
jgi:hypothetical protein